MLDTKLKNNKIVRSVANCKSSTWVLLLLLICSLASAGFFPDAREDWLLNSYGQGSFRSYLMEEFGTYYLTFLLLLALLALLLPFFKRLRQNSPFVQRFPAEFSILAIPVGLAAQQWVINLCFAYAIEDPSLTDAIHIALAICIFMGIYGIWLLSILSLLLILDMGAMHWLREKSFLIRNGKRIVSGIIGAYRQFIHDLTTIDLGSGSDQWLFRAVLVNFLFLLVCCLFFGSVFFKPVIYVLGLSWCVGWITSGLLTYSVLQFFIIRRYVNQTKEEYQSLLFTAKQMAQGNLQVNVEAATQGNPQMNVEAAAQENLQKASKEISDKSAQAFQIRSGPASNSANKQKTHSESSSGSFKPLIEALADINTGFRNAVEEETHSQAMKTELITNVSHDLKTPLTAIITYVNLLKDESISDEERRSYVDILDQKSLRLKKLIEDLFEVSKATSGNIEIKKSLVDLGELIRQAVTEQQDRLQAANIDCRVFITPGAGGCISENAKEPAADSLSAADSRILLELDSDKTYRILENLLVNMAKYALPGTRAWVQLELVSGEAVITVKNTSVTELNYDTSSLTERFVRGDKSRTTEGSGLGLAIVQSFTELQGGRFEIATDGDLFKAIVRFPCK